MGFFGVLNLVRGALIVLSALLIWRLQLFPTSRKQVRTLAIGWIALITFEYWAFGPLSFIMVGNELDWSIPFFQYMNDWHDGGRFTHAFAGGNDVWAMVGSGGQYLSLERLLLAAFPLWLASGLLKIMAATAGFVGTYLIIRRFCGVDRTLSFALATLYPLSADLFLILTASSGLSFPAIPLIAYMVVFRAGRRHYYLGVLAVASLNALSCMIPNSAVAVLFAIPAAALLVNPRHYRQIAAGFGLMAAVLLLNWHEALYGMAQMASLTHRFAVGVQLGQNTLERAMSFIGAFGISFVLSLVGLAILAWNRQVLFFRVAGVLVFTVGMAPLMFLMPWETVGLKVLDGVSYGYAWYAFPLIAGITFAQAAGSLSPAQSGPPRERFFSGRRGLSILLLALAIGQMGWYKAYNGSVWLSEGGVSLLAKAEERLDMHWVPEEPVRVVSVPYRWSINYAPALGLDSFDGGIHLPPLSLNIYWQGIVNPKKVSKGSAYAPNPQAVIGINTGPMDFKCCRRYDISEYLDFDLLRVANVGFILSVLPLQGEGITQVAGPLDDTDIPPRSRQPVLDRISRYFKLIARPSSVRVYALQPPLPRVFAARALKTVADDLPAHAFLALVGEHGLRRTVIMHQRFADQVQGVSPSLEIKGFKLVPDGIDIQVKAPDTGLLVVNIPYTPYWKASFGKNGAARPFPVNIAQMAVPVPAGTTQVAFRYDRQLLRHKVFNALEGK